MTYVPFPIADFRTGEFTAREAWLSPPDAFEVMENANIEYGVIKKREGYKIFGFFPTLLGTLDAVTASGTTDPVSIQFTGHGLVTGDAILIHSETTSTELNGNKYFITRTDADNFTLDNTEQSDYTDGGTDGTVESLLSVDKVAGISGITNGIEPIVTADQAHGLSSDDKILLTGDFNNPITGMPEADGVVTEIDVLTTTTFRLRNVNSSNWGTYSAGGDIATVSSSNNNEIVGIGELFRDEQGNKLVVCNQDRVAEYSSTLGEFTSVSTASNFTGTATDLFQMTNAFNYLWMTNFKDNVYRYDGSTLEKAVFDIDGDGGASPNFASHNDLTRCKFIFQYNRRLIMLYTVETSTPSGTFPQRVRWSRIDFGNGTTSPWDDGAADTTAGSLDADTDEEIITAQFLGDTLIVFFERSIWALRKTGSFDIPFRWEKLAEAPGIFASRFGIIQHENFIWAFGPGGIIATDGVQTKRIDDVIPQFEDTIKDANLKRVVMSKLWNVRETWLSYGTTNNSENTDVKVLDYENGAFSTYTIPYAIIGSFNFTDAPLLTWADLDDVTWEDLSDRTWASFGTLPAKPRNIIGDKTGILYVLQSSISDAGKVIPVNLLSARLNPFREQGKAARLGYVDFLLNENSRSEIEVDFYTDFNSAPHSTQTISLQNDTGNDQVVKVWKRVYVDAIGNSHRMRIRQDTNNGQLAIHSIVPYFLPTGRLLNL